MDSKNPDDRPESPKKKIRPSSTTDTNYLSTDSSTDSSNDLVIHLCEGKVVAPTRRGRTLEFPSIEANSAEDDVTVQEVVVSSSESCCTSATKTPEYRVGDADSLTNDSEDSNNNNLEIDESDRLPLDAKGDTGEQ